MSFILLGILNSQAEAAAGGDSHQFIESIDLSGVSSGTFSSIPQTYKHLEIFLQLQGNTGVIETLQINFNNDASNHTYQAIKQDSTNESIQRGGLSTYDSHIEMLDIVGDSDVGGDTYLFMTGNMAVFNYSATDKSKAAQINAGFLNRQNFAQGNYESLSAISSIKFEVVGTTFNTGSRVWLYGIEG